MERWYGVLLYMLLMSRNRMQHEDMQVMRILVYNLRELMVYVVYAFGRWYMYYSIFTVGANCRISWLRHLQLEPTVNSSGGLYSWAQLLNWLNVPFTVGANCKLVGKTLQLSPIVKCVEKLANHLARDMIPRTSRGILFTFGRRSSSKTYMVYGILVYSLW